MRISENLPRKSLMLASASVAAFILLPPAFAQDVTISNQVTNTEVNDAIAANPDPNLDLDIDNTAIVTGGDVIVVGASSGRNNGIIEISNAGDLGQIDVNGAITEVSGLSVSGNPNQIATVNIENMGLITGNIAVAGVTGNLDFSNTGNIMGDVNLAANGDISITNTNMMTQSTRATSVVADSQTTHVGTFDFSTDANGISTTDQVTSAVTNVTQTGGSITGSYSGVTGSTGHQNYMTLNQSANQDSTLNIIGRVYGDIYANAGVGTETQTGDYYRKTTVADDNLNGVRTESTDHVEIVNSVAGGNAAVNITGDARHSLTQFASTTSVQANGTETAHITLTEAGIIDVDANSTSIFRSQDNRTSQSSRESLIFCIAETDNARKSVTSSDIYSGGSAYISLADGSFVGRDATASGVLNAHVSGSADSSIGRNVVATTRLGDSRVSSVVSNFDRDRQTGNTTVTIREESVVKNANVVGNARVDLAGVVGGSVGVSTVLGTATANIYSTILGGVTVSSEGTEITSIDQTRSLGHIDPEDAKSTDFDTLSAGLRGDDYTSREVLVQRSTRNVGGVATATIDLHPSYGAAFAVNGNVNVSGLTSANVSLLNGSRINGSVTATSIAIDSSDVSTTTYGPDAPQQDVTEIQNIDSNYVGGTAYVLNEGAVDSHIVAEGRTSASVINNGIISVRLDGSLNGSTTVVRALRDDFVSAIDDRNVTDAANRVRTVTSRYSSVGGHSSFTNDGIMGGGVRVSGLTGEVNNNGTILGEITVGEISRHYQTIETTTANGSNFEYIQDSLGQQNYVVNQNGISGGINVLGAFSALQNTVNASVQPVLSSNITTTINLNEGSITLGNIDAQRDDDTDEAVTNTHLNLNGNGFWGIDVVDLVPNAANQRQETPRAVISGIAADHMEIDAGTGRVRGVDFGRYFVSGRGLTSVNKNNDGVFVIHGTTFVGAPRWTLDAKTINVNAGELHLSLLGETTPAFASSHFFGIKGDVNVHAKLLLGRRISISGGEKIIDGTPVFIFGDFTQTATGTTEFGVAFNHDTVGGAVSLSSPSYLKVDGDIDIAGSIEFNTTPDRAYVDGQSVEIIQYFGDASLTASLDPMLNDSAFDSEFVSFYLAHDQVAKKIFIVADRNSFASAAGTSNASAAATAFDDAYLSAINKTRTSGALAQGQTGKTVGENGSHDALKSKAMTDQIFNLGLNLDYNMSAFEAGKLFDDLSGGDIHASLSAIDLSVTDGNRAKHALSKSFDLGSEAGSTTWYAPFNQTSKLNGDQTTGASTIDVDSAGGTFGMDIPIGRSAALGLIAGFASHKVESPDRSAFSEIESTTIGAYAGKNIGNFYGTLSAAYTHSDVKTERALNVIGQVATADYSASQIDGSGEIGLNFDLGNDVLVTPYGEVAIKHSRIDSFEEQGIGGLGLVASGEQETFVSPSFGTDVQKAFKFGNGVSVKASAGAKYTFQGDIDSDRLVSFASGSNAFSLSGVGSSSFTSLNAGIDSQLSKRLDVFFQANHSFNSLQKISTLQGGVAIKF